MPTRLKDFATAAVAVAEPETTALVAAQLMRKHHVGALIVVDALEKSRPVGWGIAPGAAGHHSN